MSNAGQPPAGRGPSTEDVRCNLVFLADSIIQAEDGKMSAIGMFDRIGLATLPFTLESAVHVMHLKGPPGTKIQLSQKMVSPRGESIAEVDSTCELDSIGGMNVLSGIKNLLLEEEGKYKFQTFCNEELLVTATLDVVLVPEDRKTG